MTCEWPTIKRFRQSETSMYSCKQTNNIWPTYCKLQDGLEPLQPAAMRSRIHHEQNVQVVCYVCHFELKLTIHSTGLPTSFRYHLPLLLPNSKSSLQNHLSMLRVDSDLANRQALDPMRHSLALAGTRQQRRHKFIHRKAAKAATDIITENIHVKILPKTWSSKNEEQHAIGYEYIHIEVKGLQLTA